MARARAEYVYTAEDKTGRALRSVRKSVGDVDKAMNAVKASIGGVIGIGGLGLLVTNAVRAGNEIVTLSERLGTSTEALSELKFVAEQSDVNFQTLTLGLQRMTRRISEAAQGSGEAKKALEELGIPAAELNALPLDQQFEVVADALAGLENQADKVRLAMRLFDSEGVALIQTMERGAAGILEVRQLGRAMGVTLETEAATGIREADQAMKEIRASTDALSISLASNLGPAFADVLGFLSDSIPTVTGGIVNTFNSARHQSLQFFQDIVNGLDTLYGFLGRLPGDFGEAFRLVQQEYQAISEELEQLQLANADRLLVSPDPVEFSSTVGKQSVQLAKLTETTQAHTGAVQDNDKAYQAWRAQQLEIIKLEENRKEGIADIVSALQVQVETLGFTSAQLTEYELKALGADAATIQLAHSYHDQIRTFEQNQDIIAFLNEDAESSTRALNEALGDTNRIAEELGLSFDSALENAIIEGEGFREVLQGIFQDIQRIVLRKTVTEPLGDVVSSLVDSFDLGSLFGGGRAAGGPVSSGRAYLVGERGPELFVPGSAGHVVANGAGRNVTIVQHIAVDARNSDISEVKLRQAAKAGALQGVELVKADLATGGPIRDLI